MIRAKKFYLHSVRCSMLNLASILDPHLSDTDLGLFLVTLNDFS